MGSMVEQSDRSSSRMGAFCRFSAARSPPCWPPARSPHCRGRWRSGAAISRAAGGREGMPSFAWRAPSSALPNDRDFAPPLCQAWPRPLPRTHTAVMRPFGGRSRVATPLGRDRFLAKKPALQETSSAGSPSKPPKIAPAEFRCIRRDVGCATVRGRTYIHKALWESIDLGPKSNGRWVCIGSVSGLSDDRLAERVEHQNNVWTMAMMRKLGIVLLPWLRRTSLAISCGRSHFPAVRAGASSNAEACTFHPAKFAVGRKRLIAAPETGASAHSYPNAAKSI